MMGKRKRNLDKVSSSFLYKLDRIGKPVKMRRQLIWGNVEILCDGLLGCLPGCDE